MNVHEYQAKELLRAYGVPVPEGALATTPAEAESAARALGGGVTVVKAQVHAGGRGKAGGIKVAQSPADAKQRASEMLGMTLRTHQTGDAGKLVRKIYVEAGCDIARELNLGVVLDRAAESLAVIASTEGGVEIEQVAERTPEKILTVHIDPAAGLQSFHVRRVAFGLGLGADAVPKLEVFLRGLYRLFVEKDASLVEINPLVVTGAGDLLALDAKLNFDDNALYRHADLRGLRDPDEEDPRETEAAALDLAYVGLDGNIGCLVNGAGLAMATLDMLQVAGGSPANFLDVGGGTDQERVAAAFKLILQDPDVKAILVNIFGGIVRCDLVAEGVVAAAKELGVNVPLVVRLQGTNAEEGRSILADSGLDITAAETFREAGERAVAAAQGA
ncbi:MAG TPA: ADP-forming succinate--CoA ligase subunit beta [Vicinamibacterales bacterium]|nr:ADP-forming succinate--CoA ligase subunit beta [Vicinamibacterales bacterium]